VKIKVFLKINSEIVAAKHRMKPLNLGLPGSQVSPLTETYDKSNLPQSINDIRIQGHYYLPQRGKAPQLMLYFIDVFWLR